MKRAYYLIYPLMLLVYLLPFIPMSIKGVLGFAFILAGCILIGSRAALITATVCVALAAIDLVLGIDIDTQHRIISASILSVLYYIVAYFFGSYSDAVKSKTNELKEEVEKRRKAEKELSDKLAQMKSLMDTIPNPIFFKDMNCRYLGCNLAFIESLGLTEADIIGKTSEDIICSKSLQKCTESDENLLAGSGLQTFEEIMEFADGSLRNIIVNKDIFRDESQNPIGIVGVMTDITDKVEALKLKQNIAENKQIMDDIIENDKIKTEFFSNISHEFRTPLNVILGSLQLMELYLTSNQYAASREKIIKKVAVLKQNSYRLLKLVNNLIDISRIDAMAFEMHFSNCDIVSLVKDITLSVAEYTENEGIHVAFETDIESKIMACDDEKIERILLNLLSNGVKFTPKGGRISVKIFDKADGLCIKVEDNGIGIPADKQGQIFQRFCQVDRIFTRQHEGSGIGLSLVKSLVELHGGMITFVSKVGIGTSFMVYLPNNDVEEEDLKYSIIGKQAHTNRISVEFSDIYSIGG